MRLSCRSRSFCHDQEWDKLSWCCLTKESTFKVMIKRECKEESRIILTCISMWFQWVFNDNDMNNWLNEKWKLFLSFIIYDYNSWDYNIHKTDLRMKISIKISIFFISNSSFLFNSLRYFLIILFDFMKFWILLS